MLHTSLIFTNFDKNFVKIYIHNIAVYYKMRINKQFNFKNKSFKITLTLFFI
jgi:hypothetical protein